MHAQYVPAWDWGTETEEEDDDEGQGADGEVGIGGARGEGGLEAEGDGEQGGEGATDEQEPAGCACALRVNEMGCREIGIGMSMRHSVPGAALCVSVIRRMHEVDIGVFIGLQISIALVPSPASWPGYRGLSATMRLY